MMRRAVDVLGRAALALILAILVWVIAIQEGDPVRTDTFPQPIPIVILHQPPDTIVYNQSADSAQVVLRAPTSIWDRLTSNQISVTLNLANQPYGILDVPLEASVSNRIVQVVRIEPSYIHLSLEQILRRQVPITLTITGEPALGYTIRSWTASPSEVTVYGPASRVEQVAQVTASLNVQDQRQDVVQTVKLTARDDKGAPVDGITLSPEVAQAKVVVEQLGGFRDLAVRVIITGQVASGYRISNVIVSPPIVAVFGSSQAIDNLPGYVETSPVNVANAQGRVAERVPLNLPGGISLLGDPSVQVEVSIEAIQGGLTLQISPIVQGLSPSLEAQISPDYVDLVLTGPLPRLQTLKPDEDVRVVVDVANLATGTHQVTPQIIVPEGVVAKSILPPTIQVTIAPTGTFSPLPTPTVGPTPQPTIKP
jgi:YbbR domain-containing protein